MSLTCWVVMSQGGSVWVGVVWGNQGGRTPAFGCRVQSRAVDFKSNMSRNTFGKFPLWLSFLSRGRAQRDQLKMGRVKDAHSPGDIEHLTSLDFFRKTSRSHPKFLDPKDVPLQTKGERDLAQSLSAAGLSTGVYFFILFLYLLIWNQTLKKKKLVF